MCIQLGNLRMSWFLRSKASAGLADFGFGRDLAFGGAMAGVAWRRWAGSKALESSPS